MPSAFANYKKLYKEMSSEEADLIEENRQINFQQTLVVVQNIIKLINSMFQSKMLPKSKEEKKRGESKSQMTNYKPNNLRFYKNLKGNKKSESTGPSNMISAQGKN